MIENTGPDRALPVLVLFGANPADGPIGVHCSQDLEPGESLKYLGNFVPTEAWTAKLYSLRQVDFCDVFDCDGLAICDTLGEILCETLYFSKDPNAHAEFEKSFRDGGTFMDLDLTLAYGSELDIHQRSDTCSKQFIPLAVRNR